MAPMCHQGSDEQGARVVRRGLCEGVVHRGCAHALSRKLSVSSCLDPVSLDPVCLNPVCLDRVSLDPICLEPVCLESVCPDPDCLVSVCLSLACLSDLPESMPHATTDPVCLHLCLNVPRSTSS